MDLSIMPMNDAANLKSATFIENPSPWPCEWNC